MTESPRCGQPMRRNERAVPVLEDPVCGRRAGHTGQHYSEAFWRRRRYVPRAPSGTPGIAAAIVDARRRAGMSQRHLAAAVGVTQTAVRLWEHAQRTPGEQNWVQLELTLGPLGVVRDQAPEEQEAADAA